MSKRIGFLGCGKICGGLMKHIQEKGRHTISFVQSRNYPAEGAPFAVTRTLNHDLLAQTDLVIEGATADVLKENFDGILEHCDLVVFSGSVFADAEFEAHAREVIARTGHKVYLPHAAILGIDGLFDARELLTAVSIETVKNAESLNVDCTERTVLYDGPAHGACKMFPRNVNVHATTALAGLGFEKTHSRIICDPSVVTNSHRIVIEGKGIHFDLLISTSATGTVTGLYTPYSARASVDRLLDDADYPYYFV